MILFSDILNKDFNAILFYFLLLIIMLVSLILSLSSTYIKFERVNRLSLKHSCMAGEMHLMGQMGHG